MGVVLPRPAYLPLLRSLCDEHGALLIFDEVITGFRVGRGGAQQLYGVRPDLTCLGKIAGGGLPLGIYGGRADIMDVVAPVGPVYQAGTLSGNPLAVAAGLATLKRLDEHAYVTLEGLGRVLEDDLGRAIRRTGRQGAPPAGRLGVHAVLLARGGGRPDDAPSSRAPSSTPSSSTACSSAASCCRPPSSRPASSPSLTRSKTSTPSRPPPAKSSASFATP